MLKYSDHIVSSDYILGLTQVIDVATECIPSVPYINTIFCL
jgi:hypothetical protein